MLPFSRPFEAPSSRVSPLSVLGVAGAVLLLVTGCAGGPDGASRIDAQQVRPLDEVAVVSVRAKKSYRNEIDSESASEPSGVREAVHQIREMSERQRRRAAPDFGATAEQVHTYLFGPFRSAAPFALVEETSILTSSAYHRFETPDSSGRDWQASLFATPDGYRPLNPAALRTSARLQTLIEQVPADPDGLLFAHTEYALVRQGPDTQTPPAPGDTVRATVEATVRVHVLDRTGTTALKVIQTGQSDDGFTFVYGKGWTTEQIEPPTRQATRMVLANTTTRLRKNLPSGAVARLSSVRSPPAKPMRQAADR